MKNKIIAYAVLAAVAGLAAFLLHQLKPGLFQAPAAVDHAKPTIGLAKVAEVIDGDTIVIEGGEHVRYIGMNTPETVDPRKPVECYGKEASAENKKLVAGQTVRLERDAVERDKYGRLLRYVFLGDAFVNLELVKEGYAKAYPFPPNTRYRKLFTAAQRLARSTRLGLWGNCGNSGK